MQYGNYSREDKTTLNITIDIDTNCDQDTVPVMLYYDVGHIKIENNESVWNGYTQTRHYYNITGWEADEKQLSAQIEAFTEPYTGWYTVFVDIYADYNNTGQYEWVDYFYIEEMYLYEEE